MKFLAARKIYLKIWLPSEWKLQDVVKSPGKLEDEPLIADHNGWHSCPVLFDIPMLERSSEVSGCTVDLSDWTTFSVGPGEVPVFASAAASCATGRLLSAL